MTYSYANKLVLFLPVPYSTYVASGSSIGDTVTYQCDTDYYLAQGTLTVTCQNGGTWAGTVPACWRKNMSFRFSNN
jgi:hypothetical protein